MQASSCCDRFMKPQQSSSLPCVDGMSGPENKESTHNLGLWYCSHLKSSVNSFSPLIIKLKLHCKEN